MKNNFAQIKHKISKLPIEQLAVQSGFQKRRPKKIDAIGFVVGFMMMIQVEGNTLSEWARAISRFSGQLVSKQALHKKLQFRQEAFAYQLLEAALRQSLPSNQAVHRTQLFAAFGKVYLEDSSCLKLPANVADFFPGPFSHKGKCATAKIQLRMDLLAEQYESLQLQCYRDNDQKHASDIVSILQAGDLVIRDLGYWSHQALASIMERRAFFLSRYCYGTQLLDPDTGQVIDLLQLLKAQLRKGIGVVDQPVLLGKTAQLPVRLVAIRAPQKTLQARRRKAAKNRNGKANHSKEYMELLGWTIFVTNVSKEVWSYQDILKAYGFRWRIEIVFKCWKSKFQIEQLFENKQSLTPARVVITCLLFLVFLTVFFARWAAYFIQAVYEKTRKGLSILKFADFVKERLEDLLAHSNLAELLPAVAYYCTYEKRKDRCNFIELLYNKKVTIQQG